MERAQFFRSPGEVRVACPRLDKTAPLQIQDFGGLVGPYGFDLVDYVKCQLVKKSGSLCRREHGNGWVARRKSDGVEVYIGGDCADREFEAGKEYVAEKTRVRRELRIDELVSRIRGLQVDQGFRLRMNAALERQQRLLIKIVDVRLLWPASLLSAFGALGKRTNRSVQVEWKYVEPQEDDDGRKWDRISWIPGSLGSISGMEAMTPGVLRSIATRVKKVIATLEEARPSSDQPEAVLRGWSNVLADGEACERELDETSGALASFCRPENLRLLCWCIRGSDSDILQVIKGAVRLETGQELSNSAARETRKRWASEIRETNAGRDFRVV